MTAKEEFISIYKENIKREGADKLLEKAISLLRPAAHAFTVHIKAVLFSTV